MNLNTNPTITQLQAITREANDEAGNHILWVNHNGDVQLTLVPLGLGPNGFQDSQPSMRLRYETCDQGNGYVGQEAAEDLSLMTRLFKSLVKEWSCLTPSAPVHYVDSW